MKIEQFIDKGLAHFSYAILSEGKVALIDPARDTQFYYEFTKKNNAEIVAVIETHLHADFISSHLEISTAGANIFISKLAEASYPHKPFDDGTIIKIGNITLKALGTPGHSPDSISILLLDENGKEHAVFTGDTLFIGDVGRPDLRETPGNNNSKKELLAKQLFYSLRDKLMKLADDVIVYPAHGAGSLCGKSMSSENCGTIGQEKSQNYAVQEMPEQAFVKILLENQPTKPKYFNYNVGLNKKGAASLEQSIKNIKRMNSEKEIEKNILIIDSRPESQFKKGHLKGAINIQNGGKFETWLGSIVSPTEKFYLIATDEKTLEEVIYKSAKIGYEIFIEGAFAQNSFSEIGDEILNMEYFSKHIEEYTIVDVRDKSEVKEGKIFEQSLNIPLSELRERKNEIPIGKPIVVHCAGGYRSAAGSSILSAGLNANVYDLGESIKNFRAIK